VIVEKRDTDILAHARIERLISELDPTTWIICGAGLARGVLQAAVGLRSRGHAVVLAKDAVLELDDPLAEMAWRRIEAKDVVLAETADLVAPKPKRRRQARPIGQLLAMNNN
jgi:nicotinamidase-related amidase